MYTQNDLDEAVAAGAFSPEAAASLRSYVDGRRSLPAVDEEHFRLITGFNDIFVSIAAAILLFAVGWIGQAIGQAMGLIATDGGREGPSFLAPLAVAATSWGLALFFTARRRMALPSILLVFSFVFAVFSTVALIEAQAMLSVVGPERLETTFGNNEAAGKALVGGLAALAFAIAGAAAWVHWNRFRVPVTVAAGALAVVGIFLAIVAAVLAEQVGNLRNVMLGFTLLLGVGMFLFAMRWDSSDPARVTRRSDVAFWLHLLAAPMIVHPVFTLLGLNDGNATIGEGLIVVALYVVLGIAALAVDRRALLVSALAYVLYALSALFEQVGAVELNIALTALVIGSALLLLSAFWHQGRRMVVDRLPAGLQSRLPLLDRVAPSPQPAA
ncbi:hypothetical protein SH584_03365 [Sphingomonas sp. LY29]|uniref:hypothetical protein n=1 Tax=Sphingomonas sp. LY29 TaxID=3095341 RepID=UPI002D773195|nr:hypothetical protein [Sphingomonas sp. LY29]WRP26490.1 hypothetical protein SH584_03365 [Sphingomonas sp. LY29]